MQPGRVYESSLFDPLSPLTFPPPSLPHTIHHCHPLPHTIHLRHLSPKSPLSHTSTFPIKPLSPGCHKSWVQGKEISFDANTIASVLGLPFYPEKTDFVQYYLARTLDDDDVDELKDTLFIGGKDWNYGRNMVIKHVFAKHLNAEARFWVQFVCHNLYPQSHLTECKLPILRIAYGIRRDMKVDAAWLMSEFLFHLAREPKPGSFGLPWVIHKLCHAAGVYFQDDLRDLTLTPRLNRKTYENYTKIASAVRHAGSDEEAVLAPAPAPAPGIPPLASAPPVGNIDDLTQ